ncbi:MAG: ABC transporter permease [Deltaproteobacteria bacterium]|nr:ABC transporter permease [Deltaproteobacteria bacterium]
MEPKTSRSPGEKPTGSSRGAALKMVVFVAWRNLWRNPMRSGLTITAFGFGLSLMIAYSSIAMGMFKQMVDYTTVITLGTHQVHRQEFIKNQDLYALLPWSLLDRLNRDLPQGVHAAPRLYAAAMASAGDYSAGAMIRGLDSGQEAQVTQISRHIRKGAFQLDSSPHSSGKALPRGGPFAPVVIGYQLAKNLHVGVGGNLVLVTQAADGSIGNNLYRVAGILKPVAVELDRMGVLMSIQSYQELMALDSGVHEIAFSMAGEMGLDKVKQQIQAIVSGWEAGQPKDPLGGPVVVRSWQDITPAMADMIKTYDVVLVVFQMVFLSLAGLGLLNTLLMSIYERRREFGILMALGMSRSLLLAMVMAESLFLSLAAATVGSGVGIFWAIRLETYGWDFSRYIPDGLDFMGMVMEPVMYGHFTPDQAVKSVLAMLAVALAASVIPAMHMARLKPVQVLGG